MFAGVVEDFAHFLLVLHPVAFFFELTYFRVLLFDGLEEFVRLVLFRCNRSLVSLQVLETIYPLFVTVGDFLHFFATFTHELA